MRQTLSKKERLTNLADFRSAYRTGKCLRGSFVNIFLRENGLDISRIGISVPKRVVRASSERNLIKRRIREIFRKNKTVFPAGADIIIKITRPHEQMSYHTIYQEVKELCSREAFQ